MISDNTIHKIRCDDVPELRAIWNALEAAPLPKVGSFSKLFANPQVARDIKALGQTCFKKPPIQRPFDRTWAFEYDENWVVHLGRLTYNHAKAHQSALAHKIRDIFGEQGRLSGFFYYPPGGFKEWHTDYEDPLTDPEKKWRVYILRTTKDNKSWFQYFDHASGSIRKIVDRNGYMNLFVLPESPPLWHAVFSNTHRWSVGIKFDEEIIERLVNGQTLT